MATYQIHSPLPFDPAGEVNSRLGLTPPLIKTLGNLRNRQCLDVQRPFKVFRLSCHHPWFRVVKSKPGRWFIVSNSPGVCWHHAKKPNWIVAVKTSVLCFFFKAWVCLNTEFVWILTPVVLQSFPRLNLPCSEAVGIFRHSQWAKYQLSY